MNKEPDQIAVFTEQAIPFSTADHLSCPPLSCHLKRSKLSCLIGPHRTQLRRYLHMLAGISMPKQGRVDVLGQQVSKLDQLAWQRFRAQIGYLSGAAPLLSAQHALMNVMLPVLYHLNLPFREAADKARTLLAELDCHFQATSYPAQLNSFQRAQLGNSRTFKEEPGVRGALR